MWKSALFVASKEAKPEKAYRERSGGMEYLKIEDSLEPFHSDWGYQDLLKRMRLPSRRGYLGD
jgi:hypothetical protein